MIFVSLLLMRYWSDKKCNRYINNHQIKNVRPRDARN